MPEIPFALQWTIPENSLRPLKDSIKNERLFSTSIFNVPNFEYYMIIYPNGYAEEHRGQTWISLYLKLKNVKKVNAKWNVSIQSANRSVLGDAVFEKNGGWGNCVCDTKDFFDPEKKFVVNGKCTIRVHGTFKFDNENSLIAENEQQQKWNNGDLGDKLWGKNDSKDFTIIVDEKEIKAHKLILDAQSNVFSAMLNPKMKESIESKVVIPDFSFDVVENAIKLIYNCNFTSSLTFDGQMSLLQFFDKYDLLEIKEKIQQLLINQISASNVCRLTNCSILTNSETLKNKCVDFMVVAVETKTPLADIEILDKEIAFEILQISLCQIVEIE